MTLHDLFIAPFAEFEFMRRALAGVIVVAVGGAPVGVILMLRRMSLMGETMAHAILPGAALGFLVSGLNLAAMTAGGLIAGLAVALSAGAVARATELKEDAALAAFFLVSLALGVTIVSMRGTNVDLLNFLFGNVLALDNETLAMMATIVTASLVVFAAIWRPLLLESVDPGFLRSVSRAGAPAHTAFLSLVVMNLVAGFFALGTVLAVGIMIVPAATARFWAQDVTRMILVAIAAGVVAGVAGLIASYHLGTPSGPTVILAAGALYLASVLFGRHGGIVPRLLPRRHLEA